MSVPSGEPMLLTRREAIAGCGGGLAMLTGLPAFAQAAYPSRTVKMIVPFPPGGTTDFLGRLVADRLKTGSWCHRHRREQARRRLDARRRAGGEGRTGWLYAVDGHLDHACHQQDALQEAGL